MITIPGYKITKTIGRGGMATVYQATQESVGRLVAIKVMSPALAADPSFSDRFVKEARMANLAHPNIVTVYDAGAIDDVNYIVMEYASGGNLDTAIKQGISIYRTLEVMKQIASALDYSCTKGFIHRDVKPENIIFREDGSAVLMDFGIAKAISSGTQLTMVGSTIGSPNYMSPEQARGLELDGRSDLYSLGIVFFEALTGTKPYDASDTFVIGLKHINDPVPQLPGKLNEFQPIIEKLLAKLPESRFDNGNQLIEALEVFNFNKDDLNDNIHKIASKSGTESTHVNYSRDAKTKSANTVVNDPTQQISEATQAVETEVVETKADQTQILSGGTQTNNDETQVYPDNDPNDKTRVSTTHETNEIDNTVVIPKRPDSAVKPEKSKTGLFTTLILIIMAGGVYFWSVSQPEETPIITKTPAEVTLPIAIKPELVKPEPIKSDITEVKKNEKIEDLSKIENIKPTIIPEKTKRFKSLISKDLSIKEIQGIHISENKNEAKWFAQQDMINHLYNRILSQCNVSDKRLNSPECLNIYNNYLKHWPLPLKGTSLKTHNNKTQISFNSKKYINAYKKQLKTLSQVFNDSNKSTNEKTLALANYENLQTVASLLGIKTQEIDNNATHEFMSSQQKQNATILTQDELNKFVLIFINNKQTYLAPITNKNSLEVTPFAAEIYQSLPSKVKKSQLTAQYHLFLEYDLQPDGDVAFNLQLFNNKNELTALNSVLLDSAFLNDHRKTSQIFNNDIQAQEHLNSSYDFSANIAMDKQSNNPLLLVGESTSLNVKLAQSGFYFIAVHVMYDDDQYSYLLPLSQAEIPFVQIISPEQSNRFIELGKFEVTPPTGVEVLQLIASNINLEKYLPDNHWDDKRKQFIINGSEGNMQNGITEVRNYINTLPKVSRVKNAKWQERLLVTSILEN